MYKKISCLLLLLLFLSACKTTQTVTESNANEELAATNVIKEHYNLTSAFKTLNIRANAKYEDHKQSVGVTADIRIQKDELIWVSVKKFGITMARAQITPKKVSYYEVLNGTYFDGNYDLISNWLGTDLDFQKVQNLFLGKALDDLTKEKYIASIVDGLYKVAPKKNQLPKKNIILKPLIF